MIKNQIQFIKSMLTYLIVFSFFIVLFNDSKGQSIANQKKERNNFCPPFMYDYNTLTETSQKFMNKEEPIFSYGNNLIAEANRWMDSSYYSVTTKKYLPISGNKHDYYSIGVYWWPDTSKENGEPYIRRDGIRNPERFKFDSPPLHNMISAVESITLAYVLTHDSKYKDKAIGFLNTWFVNEDTKMNPHLEYGQAIPGISNGRGIGIIETYGLIDVVDAIGILYREKALSNENYENLKQWFTDYKHWLTTSQNGIDEKNWHNNHGSSWDYQTLSFSLFAGDSITAKSILDSVATKRINKQIEPDGTQPFELDRTRAFHYTIYNLRFLCGIATLGEKLNRDIWNYKSEDNRSISNAIQFTIPYVFEGKEWTYERMDDMEQLKNDFYEVLNLANNKIENLDLLKYLKEYSTDDYGIQKELLLRPNNIKY